MFRLLLDGFVLDAEAYRRQRDESTSLGRGFVLVLLIGMIVGVAALVGRVLEAVTGPSSGNVQQIIFEGLSVTPLNGVPPPSPTDIKQVSDVLAVVQIIRFSSGVSTLGGVLDLVMGKVLDLTQQISLVDSLMVGVFAFVLAPVTIILSWLLGGIISHFCARAMGGKGTLSQTLNCTALAQAPHTLCLLWLIPFSHIGIFAGMLLQLTASSLALHYAQGISPRRAAICNLVAPLLITCITLGIVILLAVRLVPAETAFLHSIVGNVGQ